MALHQILDEKKIAHRREDRDEQNADGRFALIE